MSVEEVAAEVARLPRDITAAIDDHIEDRGLQRKDVAARMGVSAGRVSQILSGDENLTLRTLGTISAALGIQLELTIVDASDDQTTYADPLPQGVESLREATGAWR